MLPLLLWDKRRCNKVYYKIGKLPTIPENLFGYFKNTLYQMRCVFQITINLLARQSSKVKKTNLHI